VVAVELIAQQIYSITGNCKQKSLREPFTSEHLSILIIMILTMIDWTAIFTWAQGTPAVLLTALLVIYWYIRIPSDMPKNIPTVPIYISLLGLWSDMGQDDIFDRWLRIPLEKHGAVKIWFAGRWNVLATRPQFLVDMFRHEDVYAKAGSQKKIPWSVIAALVGDNIINAHGQNWKLYTSIMKPGLQRRITDSVPLLEKSRLFVDILLEEQDHLGESGVLVNPIIQRWALSCMGISFMNVDLEVCSPFPAAAYTNSHRHLKDQANASKNFRQSSKEPSLSRSSSTSPT
jgi:unspecific monooxygenase